MKEGRTENGPRFPGNERKRMERETGAAVACLSARQGLSCLYIESGW